MNELYSMGAASALSEFMAAFDKGQLYVPMGTPEDSSEITAFYGFGIESAGDTFRTGWQFTINTDSEACKLKAFSAGTISYETATYWGGSTNRMILVTSDFLGELLRRDALPSWFPYPRYVIYDNVDETQTGEIIRTYLSDNHEIVDAAYENSKEALIEKLSDYLAAYADVVSALSGKSEEEITAYLDSDENYTYKIELVLAAFLEGGVLALPVEGGEGIGLAASVDSASRQVSISMKDDDDWDNDLYLNPAFYFHHCSSFFKDLDDHPLKSEFQKLFGGPKANGTVLYVQTELPEGAAYTAYSSVSDALSHAASNDTIVIADSQTYSVSSEITIDKPINITSLSESDVIEDEEISLPSLEGSNDISIFSISNVEGLVSISNLGITGGGRSGIRVEHADQTYIRNCYIHHCDYAGSSYARFWKAVGGGISLVYSSAYIYRNFISHNTTPANGGGINGRDYSWVTIENNIIENNSADIDGGGVALLLAYPRFTDSFKELLEDLEEYSSDIEELSSSDLTEIIPNLIETYSDFIEVRSDLWETAKDGYIGLVSPKDAWDSGYLAETKQKKCRIVKNIIRNNIASDNGGGVYLSVCSPTIFKENEISSNTAASGGGGIRCSLASDIILNGDQIYNNATTSSGSVGQDGGGGICSRNCSVELNSVSITDNWVDGRPGGGIFFTSSDEGDIATYRESLGLIIAILLDWLGGYDGYDFNNCLRDIFEKTECTLTISSDSVIQENGISQFSTQPPQDYRQGGGLYVARHSTPLEVKNGAIEFEYWRDIQEVLGVYTADEYDESVDPESQTASNYYYQVTADDYDGDTISDIGLPDETEVVAVYLDSSDAVNVAKSAFTGLPLTIDVENIDQISDNTNNWIYDVESSTRAQESEENLSTPDAVNLYIDDQYGRPDNPIDDSNYTDHLISGTNFYYESAEEG